MFLQFFVINNIIFLDATWQNFQFEEKKDKFSTETRLN